MGTSTGVRRTLHFGPLAGQEVTVYPQIGGVLPTPIFAHAPLGMDHVGEPTGRHRYALSSRDALAEYGHSVLCWCVTATLVDTPAD